MFYLISGVLQKCVGSLVRPIAAGCWENMAKNINQLEANNKKQLITR